MLDDDVYSQLMRAIAAAGSSGPRAGSGLPAGAIPAGPASMPLPTPLGAAAPVPPPPPRRGFNRPPPPGAVAAQANPGSGGIALRETLEGLTRGVRESLARLTEHSQRNASTDNGTIATMPGGFRPQLASSSVPPSSAVPKPGYRGPYAHSGDQRSYGDYPALTPPGAAPEVGMDYPALQPGESAIPRPGIGAAPNPRVAQAQRRPALPMPPQPNPFHGGVPIEPDMETLRPGPGMGSDPFALGPDMEIARPGPGMGAAPPAAQPGFMDRLGAFLKTDKGGDAAERLLNFGLATMAAGGRPGATALGAIGEGGLAAQQLGYQNAERRDNKAARERQLGQGERKLHLEERELVQKAQARLSELEQKATNATLDRAERERSAREAQETKRLIADAAAGNTKALTDLKRIEADSRAEDRRTRVQQAYDESASRAATAIEKEMRDAKAIDGTPIYSEEQIQKRLDELIETQHARSGRGRLLRAERSIQRYEGAVARLGEIADPVKRAEAKRKLDEQRAADLKGIWD